MHATNAGLVDIVRDFLLADQAMRRLFARYRQGKLRFEEVQDLVGDHEGSVLFRLKERCHALFRPRDRASGVAMRREALFDLAVGSLFHEAMKFRENFYQRAVYAPKVRALRSDAGPEADELFGEFEKILAAASIRLDEALQETEALLAQTREQFRVLLVTHRESGIVARYLIENASLVGEVFAEGLDALLASIHGDAGTGYSLAARSYLASGYFGEARRALAEALARSGSDRDLLHLSEYAEGMDAYLAGRYDETLARLGRWIEGGVRPDEGSHAELAFAAVSRIGQLVDDENSANLVRAAATLARQIEPHAPRARGIAAS